MKHIKNFIICVSVSIFLQLLMPVFPVLLKIENSLIFYIISAQIFFIFTIIFGVKTIIKSRQLFNEENYAELQKMWLGLKLLNVPVFILNFVFCVVFASLGFMLFPLNAVVITVNSLYVFLCVILSGFVGFSAIKAIKKAGGKIYSVCCVMQFIPFWDVVSTLILKCKELL